MFLALTFLAYQAQVGVGEIPPSAMAVAAVVILKNYMRTIVGLTNYLVSTLRLFFMSIFVPWEKHHFR